MNKTISIIIALIAVIVIGVFILNKRGDAPLLSNSDEPVNLHTSVTVPPGATGATDGTYTLAEGSVINWAGNKTLLPSWIDTGTITIKTGSLSFSAGLPVSGILEFDMNSLASTATGTGNDEGTLSKLSGHLKSPDWFNAAQYPTATFVLTRVTPAPDAATSFKYSVTGRLTLKDITQEITFDAYIYNTAGQLKLAGSADVDRTLWDIRFGSAKFFQDLGDKVINDIFVVNFDITASQTQ